jgi:ribonuclease P protein component
MSARAQRLQGSWLFVDVCSNLHIKTRLGITVTRKYGNACTRNRFKRMVREAFRLSYQHLPQGLDLVVRPRRGIQTMLLPQLKDELLSLLGVLQS